MRKTSELYANPDYTGASSGKYVDKYTNRPEDMGGLNNILRQAWGKLKEVNTAHNERMDQEITPGAGFTQRDLLDMVTGAYGGLKLFRGIPKKEYAKAIDGLIRGGDRHKYLYTAPGKTGRETAEWYAKNMGMKHAEASPRVMEFDLPWNKVQKYTKNPDVDFSGWNPKRLKNMLKTSNVDQIILPRGLPEKYLKKVHKLLDAKQTDFRKVFKRLSSSSKADLIKKLDASLKKKK